MSVDPMDNKLPDRVAQALFLPPPPYWLVLAFIILIIASWLPLVLFARARFMTSEEPRVHLFQDMDVQPRYGPQASSRVFADGRAMRPPVPGTIARGELTQNDHLHRGYRSVQDSDGWKIEYLSGYSDLLNVDESFVLRGQMRYNIYCAPCHGFDGHGEGMVHQRALELEEPKWIPPTSLHTDTVRARENGHLFNTITNGIRNMPPYGHQIPVEDRWAIVAYIRALQRSQHASIEDVPDVKRGTLK